MSTAMSPSRRAWISRVIGALLVVDVVVFLIMGANRPKRPTLAPPGRAAAPVPTPSAGQLSDTGIRVTISGAAPTAGLSTHCYALADTTAQRARGLMGQTSLGGYRGMAFVYAGDSNASYDMKDTPLPLQIAFFAANGRFLSSTAMAPCPATTASCPRYQASGPFRLALEVPLGQLGGLGVGPGSSAQMAGPCSA